MRQSVLKLFLIAAVAGLSFVKNGFCQDLGDITDLVESTNLRENVEVSLVPEESKIGVKIKSPALEVLLR